MSGETLLKPRTKARVGRVALVSSCCESVPIPRRFVECPLVVSEMSRKTRRPWIWWLFFHRGVVFVVESNCSVDAIE